MRGTFAHFLTIEKIPYRVRGVPGVGILAERAGYKEPEAVPDYPVPVLLEAIDADADADADSFEPSFFDMEQPYTE